jgi:hypothetical protein
MPIAATLTNKAGLVVDDNYVMPSLVKGGTV